MPAWVRWPLAAAIVVLIVGLPLAVYRAQYAHAKRFREVTPGRFYRSGQMTAAGLREAIERYGIKTVINLQHENPDPLMPEAWRGTPSVRESELCRQLGVQYILLKPDVLPEPNTVETRPPVLDEYLRILDDPASYPVLIHCKAGLHRTGRLTAVYRMEYEGWSVGEAVRELRANGYGYSMASEADDFVVQFIQNYEPRPRADRGRTAGQPGASRAVEGGRP
jgi:tyrosine-protein phosphatase SIW14